MISRFSKKVTAMLTWRFGTCWTVAIKVCKTNIRGVAYLTRNAGTSRLVKIKGEKTRLSPAFESRWSI